MKKKVSWVWLLMIGVALFGISTAIYFSITEREIKYNKELGYRIKEEGACLYILDDQDRVIGGGGFHEIWKDDTLGYRIGSIGSRSYLLDSIGVKINRFGYHRFFRRNGAIWGTAGAAEEIVICADGTVVNYPSSLFQRTMEKLGFTVDEKTGRLYRSE